jgi:predicted short-subunit dehydrogenase-like oxidoreductase (DUF2520 family)
MIRAVEPLSVLGRGKAGRALAQALQVPNLPHDARPDGVVLLAVPDHAVAQVAAAFPRRAAHLSGSLHLPDVPSAHPLTSFDGHPADWRGTPLALTGPVPPRIVSALTALGFAPFDLPAEHKALYHAAAVLTSGHAATLWLGAASLLAEAGVPLPGRGLWPLAQATLRNIEARGAAGRTGPFVRGDTATIQRDAAALPEAWREVFLKLGVL